MNTLKGFQFVSKSHSGMENRLFQAIEGDKQ